jgi:hypothetical protein
LPDAEGLLRNALIVTDWPILNLISWYLDVGTNKYVYVSDVSENLLIICHSNS